MQKLAPSMTRTAFCKNCKRGGYPKKHTAYIVYAGSHESYSLYLHVGNVSKRDIGMTPHVFFDTFKVIPVGNASKDHYCVTKCLCGVIGCGFDIKLNEATGLWSVSITHEPEFTYVKGQSMGALREFKDKGLHLTSVDVKNWRVDEIINEQREVFRHLGRA